MKRRLKLIRLRHKLKKLKRRRNLSMILFRWQGKLQLCRNLRRRLVTHLSQIELEGLSFEDHGKVSLLDSRKLYRC